MDEFVLSKELLEQIFFGMENQRAEFFLDMKSIRIVGFNEAVDSAQEDLVAIPEWQPVDGYNLMESFVTSLNNPPVKAELHQVLQSGKRVFREFKRILKKHHEVECLWFAFREKTMKKRVIEWYDRVCESRGLATLKDEVVETEDLIFSDFIIRVLSDVHELEAITDLDKKAFEEFFLQPDDASYWYSFSRDHLPRPVEPGNLVLGLYNPSEVLCGFIWAMQAEISPKRYIAHILQLYVEPAYRGLGIARTLFSAYLDRCKEEEISNVAIETYSGILGDMLDRHNFTVLTQTYCSGTPAAKGDP